MDITVTIKAPELASAIKALAESIGWAVANRETERTQQILEADIQDNQKRAQEKDPPIPEQMELVPPTAPAAPVVTFDQLQAKAAELVRSGNRDRVKAVLDQFGVTKISLIPEDQRAEAMVALGAA